MGLESIPELSIADANSLRSLNGLTVQDLKVRTVFKLVFRIWIRIQGSLKPDSESGTRSRVFKNNLNC